ncbi:putative restriction endonuclease protein [uncultured Pleomorphomonas sp.]|uniref:Putative restriction endonuclease protein n=1 Tax=uncultured Pleomorphomonas sp. TaxID=442121 RepID=A0A212LD22_9HYPH|nr:restriction endonuclease [uncultured Pleomorphomonas sp.]SCM75462.1 putative restriction endonuclease protein [uncultured Pleomorphomonas sp.]
MSKAWMVRAERNGRLFDVFKQRSLVAIGWSALGDLSEAKTRKAVSDAFLRAHPEGKAQSQAMAAGQLHRFVNEMTIGDMVVTYDPSRRTYLVGEISSAYRHDKSVDPEDTQVRSVRWDGEVSRDLLSVESRNSLGSISTLFRLSNQVSAELKKALSGNATPSVDEASPVSEAAEEDVFENMASRAHEFIKDKVSALNWDEMQELVAGLLRSLGYKTRVSDNGPDRGKDIVASPDGFGFESPRIVVEVKHRKGAMGAPDVRSFLGGRHPQDKGLYVSTGGFTREARYEAERANIPTALMDLDDLVKSLLEQYDKLDLETQQLIPLKRIFVPAWN